MSRVIQAYNFQDYSEAIAAYEEAWEADPAVGAVLVRGVEPVCLDGFNIGCSCPNCTNVPTPEVQGTDTVKGPPDAHM